MSHVNVQRVAVGPDFIEVVQQSDGSVWVPIKRVCEALGIASEMQTAKLKRKPWARVMLIIARDSAGRVQPAMCVHADDFPMWMAGIERVSPEVKDTLLRFQREARDVLADHFLGRREKPQPMSGVAMLRAMADALEAQERAIAAETAARKELEVRVDKVERAPLVARESKRRTMAAVQTVTRAIQRHCAEHGIDFRAMFSAARNELGLRPTSQGGASLSKSDLRADQVLRLARFATVNGVHGVGVAVIESILNGVDNARVIESTEVQ